MARFWFGLALLLASCASPRIGEVGPTACMGGKDEDHDDLIDCDDPDCQNLDECRGLVSALDGGTRDGGRAYEGGVIGPPLLIDGGHVVIPRKDGGSGGMDDEDDAGAPGSIPLVDAGPATCTPACKDTEECIKLECKAVTASTSQAIAVTIEGAGATNIGFLGECLDLDCGSPGVICCPLDSFVRVVQVHADGSADKQIGRTATAMGMSFQITYPDPTTWTVDLAEGDYLVFELWDENPTMGDRMLFDCKPDLANLTGGRQTCRSLIGATPAWISADLELKK